MSPIKPVLNIWMQVNYIHQQKKLVGQDYKLTQCN